MKKLCIITLFVLLQGVVSAQRLNEELFFEVKHQFIIDTISLEGVTVTLPGGIEIPGDSIKLSNGSIYLEGTVSFYLGGKSIASIIKLCFICGAVLIVLALVMFGIVDDLSRANRFQKFVVRFPFVLGLILLAIGFFSAFAFPYAH